MASAPIMLTLSLFREDEPTKQLTGTVFVKTAPDHTVARVAKAFCLWVGLPVEACALLDGRTLQPLDAAAQISAAGLASSSPVIVYVSKACPAQVDPKAAAAPFTVVDVLDSEMANLLPGMAM